MAQIFRSSIHTPGYPSRRAAPGNPTSASASMTSCSTAWTYCGVASGPMGTETIG